MPDSPTTTLDAGRVSASLFRRQRLHPSTRARDVTALAHDILALHATDPATIHLSAWARLEPETLADVAAALRRALVEKRTLVRTVAMRHTLFVVASSELAPFQSAYVERLGTAERRRCKRLLVSAGCCDEASADDFLNHLCEKVCDALGDVPRTVPELAQTVPELAANFVNQPEKPYGGKMTIGSHLVDGMGVLGYAVRGPVVGGWRSGQCAWARLDRWLPNVDATALEPAAGRSHVLRRYLDVFAPVTFDDAVWWTGFTKGQIRAALETVDDLVRVEVEGWDGEYLALAGQLEELSTGSETDGDVNVALLPALDPYVMGYKRRQRFFDPDWISRLFDRNGNAGPTVWVSGRCLGGWAQRADGKVVFELLEPASKIVRAAVAAEARRLEQALGEERVKPRFPTPLVKELQA